MYKLFRVKKCKLHPKVVRKNEKVYIKCSRCKVLFISDSRCKVLFISGSRCKRNIHDTHPQNLILKSNRGY